MHKLYTRRMRYHSSTVTYFLSVTVAYFLSSFTLTLFLSSFTAFFLKKNIRRRNVCLCPRKIFTWEQVQSETFSYGWRHQYFKLSFFDKFSLKNGVYQPHTCDEFSLCSIRYKKMRTRKQNFNKYIVVLSLSKCQRTVMCQFTGIAMTISWTRRFWDEFFFNWNFKIQITYIGCPRG